MHIYVYIYIYIYVHTYMCVCVCMTEAARGSLRRLRRPGVARQGRQVAQQCIPIVSIL